MRWVDGYCIVGQTKGAHSGNGPESGVKQPKPPLNPPPIRILGRLDTLASTAGHEWGIGSKNTTHRWPTKVLESNHLFSKTPTTPPHPEQTTPSVESNAGAAGAPVRERAPPTNEQVG